MIVKLSKSLPLLLLLESSVLRCRTLISFSISCYFLVDASLAISRLMSPCKFYISFIFDKLPNLPKTFFSVKYVITVFVLWHGVLTCIKIDSSTLPIKSDSWVGNRSCKIFLYWAFFIVLCTTWSRPVPILLMTDRTMNDVGSKSLSNKLCFISHYFKNGLVWQSNTPMTRI